MAAASVTLKTAARRFLALDGVFIPLTTPFARDGRVSWPALRENLAEYEKIPFAGESDPTPSQFKINICPNVHVTWVQQSHLKFTEPTDILSQLFSILTEWAMGRKKYTNRVNAHILEHKFGVTTVFFSQCDIVLSESK